MVHAQVNGGIVYARIHDVNEVLPNQWITVAKKRSDKVVTFLAYMGLTTRCLPLTFDVSFHTQDMYDLNQRKF